MLCKYYHAVLFLDAETLCSSVMYTTRSVSHNIMAEPNAVRVTLTQSQASLQTVYVTPPIKSWLKSTHSSSVPWKFGQIFSIQMWNTWVRICLVRHVLRNEIVCLQYCPSTTDLELRFKSGKALKEGLYYAILPSKQSVFELENARQSVEYNKIQTVSLQFHQV